jgi:hypothetical protein
MADAYLDELDAIEQGGSDPYLAELDAISGGQEREKQFRPVAAGIGQSFQNAANRFGQGVIAGPALIEAAARRFVGPTPSPSDPTPLGAYLSAEERIKAGQSAASSYDERPGFAGIVQRGAEGAAGSVPDVATGMGVARTVKAAAPLATEAANQVARVIAGAKTAAATTTTREVQDTPTLENLPNAVAQGFIEGLFTRLGGATGVESILRSPGGPQALRRKLVEHAMDAGLEMPEEGLTSGVQALARMALTKEQYDPNKVTDEIATGAMSGLMMSAGMAAPRAAGDVAVESMDRLDAAREDRGIRDQLRRMAEVDALRNLGGEVSTPETADPVQVDARTVALAQSLAPSVDRAYPEGGSARDAAFQAQELARQMDADAAKAMAAGRRRKFIESLTDEAESINTDRKAGMESLAQEEAAAARRRMIAGITDEAASISQDRQEGMAKLSQMDAEAERQRKIRQIADDAEELKQAKDRMAEMDLEAERQREVRRIADEQLYTDTGASSLIAAEGRAPDVNETPEDRQRFDILEQLRQETDQRHQLRLSAITAKRRANQIGKPQSGQEKAASEAQRAREYADAAQAVAEGRPLPSWSALSQEVPDAQDAPQDRPRVAPGPVPVPGSARAPAAPAPQAAPAADAQAAIPAPDAGQVARRARVVPVPNGSGFRVAITDGIRPVRFLRPGNQPGSAQDAQTFATAGEAEKAANASLGDRWEVGMSDQARRNNEQAQRDAEMERAQQEAGDRAVATIEGRAREILARYPGATHYDLMREMSDHGFRVDKSQQIPADADARGLALRQALAQRGEDLRGMFDRIKGETQRVPPAAPIPSPAPRPVAPVEAGDLAPRPVQPAVAPDGGQAQAGREGAGSTVETAPVGDRPGNNVTDEVTPANGGTGMTEDQAAAPYEYEMPFRVAPAARNLTGDAFGQVGKARVGELRAAADDFVSFFSTLARGAVRYEVMPTQGLVRIDLPGGRSFFFRPVESIPMTQAAIDEARRAGAVKPGETPMAAGVVLTLADGQKLVQMAKDLGKDDAKGTAWHEAVHLARGLGLINDAEWAALSKKFPALNADPEEAVARGVEGFRPPFTLGARIRGAFARLGNWLRRKKLAAYVPGVGHEYNADALAEDIQTGRVMLRDAGQGSAGGGFSVRGGKPAEKGGGFPRRGVGDNGAGRRMMRGDPRAFIEAPGGGRDFGAIPGDMAKAMGIAAGMPIRLQSGMHDMNSGGGFGIVHLEEADKAINRGVFKAMGMTPAQFVSEAARRIRESTIYQTPDRFISVVPFTLPDGMRIKMALWMDKGGEFLGVNHVGPLFSPPDGKMVWPGSAKSGSGARATATKQSDVGRLATGREPVDQSGLPTSQTDSTIPNTANDGKNNATSSGGNTPYKIQGIAKRQATGTETGRPDLANPGETPEARQFVTDARAGMEAAGEPGTREWDTVAKEADAKLAANRKGEEARILDIARAGDQMRDTEVVMARRLINDMAGDALSGNDPMTQRKMLDLVVGYTRGGTETARALAIRRDPLETPEQRVTSTVVKALFTPPQRTMRTIDDLEKKVATGSPEEQKQARDDIAKLKEQHRKRIEKIKQQLAAMGIDVSDVQGLAANPHKAAAAVREIQAHKADTSDAIYEWWISSILSGPKTQIANISGNLINGTLLYGAEKPLRAAVNLVTGGGNAESFTELMHLYRAAGPALGRGVRSFFETWRTERPRLEEEVMGKQLLGAAQGEERGPAIGGTKGRIVRIPLRLLQATDEFFKTFVANMEVGAQAYRRGKAKGLSGAELEAHIRSETQNLGSQAWLDALEEARKVTFQQDNAVASKIQDIRGKVPGARFLLPFVKTPTNIFARGMALSPIGAANIARKLAQGLIHRASPDSMMARPFTRSEIISDAVSSVAGTVALLALAASNDDDDPWITGSQAAASTGENQLNQRVAPPFSVKIDGKWWSYARLEPIATALGFAVDAGKIMNAETDPKRSKISKSAGAFAEQLQNKTFLKTVGDLIEIASDPERRAGEVIDVPRDIITGFVPNFIKQGIGATQDTVRESRVFAEPWTDAWWGEQGRVAAGKSAGGETFAPKVDLWGKELQKGASDSPASDFLFRLLSPADSRPDSANVYDRALLAWNNSPAGSVKPAFPMLPRNYIERKDGSRWYFTPEQYHDFLVQRGELALKILGNWQPADPANPKPFEILRIKNAITGAGKRTLAPWKTEAAKRGELMTDGE